VDYLPGGDVDARREPWIALERRVDHWISLSELRSLLEP
jgi:hypothetical protein